MARQAKGTMADKAATAQQDGAPMGSDPERNATSMWWSLGLAVLLGLASAVQAGDAAIGGADGTFEGGFGGMVIGGDARLVDRVGALLPAEGTQAALLTTEPDDGAAPTDIDTTTVRIEGFTIPVDTAELRLDYNFLTDEPLPSLTNDAFTVRLVLVTAGGEERLLKADTFGTFFPAHWGDYAHQTGFLIMRADVSAYAGSGELFTLELRADDAGDGRGDSAVLVDRIEFIGADEPIADAGLEYREAGAGEAVVFDGSASGDPDDAIVEYRWDFKNGFFGIGRFVEHAYAEDGIYQPTLTVTDEAGNTSTDTFLVVVGDTNHAPVIISAPATLASEGVPYSYSMAVEDAEIPFGDTLTFELVSGPAGMAVDEATGEVTWTPPVGAAIRHDVTVRVTDSRGLEDSQSYTIVLGAEVYIVATEDNGRIYEARSNGNGTFSNFRPVYDSGTRTRGAAIADFDGDGDFDMVSGDNSNPSHSIYLYEREAGRFLAPVFLTSVGDSTDSAGSWVMDMAAEDFDNDGAMDFLVNGDNEHIWLLRNRGALEFGDATFYAGDFETGSDGWGGQQCRTAWERVLRADAADPGNVAGGDYVARVYATGASCLSIDINPSSWDFHNGHKVSFAYRIPAGVPVGLLFNISGRGWILVGGSPGAINNDGSVADVPAADYVHLVDDGDWHHVTFDLWDIVHAVWPDAITITEFEWWTDDNAVDGDEFWFDDFKVTRRTLVSGFDQELLPDTGGNGRGTDAADVDGDGDLDFARARHGDGSVYLYTNDGDGNFTTSFIGDPGSDPYGVVLADFDNDGVVDLIANNNGSGNPYFFKGTGNGSFQSGVYIPSLDTDNYTSLGVYDFNDDGNADIVAVDYSSRNVWSYPGKGDATFGPRIRIGGMPGNTLGVAAPAGRVLGQPFAFAAVDSARVNEGEAVTASSAGSYDDGSVTGYSWDFGDGTVLSGADVTHTYADEGEYTIVLTITDDEGLTDRANVAVTVFGPPPTADAGGPYTVPEGAASHGRWPVQLNGTGSSDPDTAIARYEWDQDTATDSDGDGDPANDADLTGATPRAVYEAPGAYTVGLTVFDAVGQSHTTTTTVTAGTGAAPAAVLDGPAELGEASASLGVFTGEYDLSAATDAEGIASYTLDWSDGSTPFSARNLKDDFEDGELATNPAWSTNRGAWSVIDGAVHQTATDTGNTWAWLQDRNASYSDFELEVDVTPLSTSGDGYIGIAFRNSNGDASTTSYLMYSRNSWGHWSFYNWATGTVLADGGAGWDPGITYHLRLRVEGGAMRLYVTPEGGSESLAVEAFHQDGRLLSGGIALLAHSQTVAYDNLTVRHLGDGLRPAHAFAGAGSRDVVLTVTDHAGQTDSATLATEAVPGAPPVAATGGPYTLGELDAWDGVWDLILDLGGSTDDVGVERYEVDFGDGTTATFGVPDGRRSAYFAVGTDLYGLDMPDSSLRSIVATEDDTLVEVINLDSREVMGSTTLDRLQSWSFSPGDGVYFKVRAGKSVVVHQTDNSRHSAFVPSVDGSPVGREFLYDHDSNDGFFVFAVEDALVRFHQANGTLEAERFLRAGSYWWTPLPDRNYRVVASGRVALQTLGINGYTTVPAAGGDGVGRLFYAAVSGWSTGAVAVLAHADAQVDLYDLDSGVLIQTQAVSAGDVWYRNGLGERRIRVESDADIEVWAGDTEGGAGITDLGDDISMAGGRKGTEFVLHTLQDGIVIFAPNDGTDIAIDGGAFTATLDKDEYLRLAPGDFPGGTGTHRIEASQPVVIQSLGRANNYNDLGTYHGGVTARHHYRAVGDYDMEVTAYDRAGQAHTATTTVAVTVGDPPVPVIDAPAVADEGFAAGGLWRVDFDAGGSSDDNGIIGFAWDFGDGSSGSGETVSHDYAEPGVYTVSLTVTDRAGQQTTTTHEIEVAFGDGPVADTGGPYTLGEAEASHGSWTAVLDAGGSTDDVGIFDYQWTFAPTLDATFDGTALDGSAWYASGATQDGAVSITGAGWGNHYLFTRAAYDRGPQTELLASVRLMSPSGGSQNTMWGFKDAAPNQFSFTDMPYAIYFTNGAIRIYEDGSNRGNVGSYTPGVPYDLRITTRRGGGAIYEVKRADVSDWTTLYTSNHSTESPLRVGLTVNTGTFQVDDMTVVERKYGPVVSQVYAEPGVYGVSLRVRDNALQADNAATTVTVEQGAPPLANAGGPYRGEVGSMVVFNGAASTDDTAIQAYDWGFGNSTGGASDLPFTGRGATPLHFYDAEGTYDVTLTVTDNVGQTDTAATSVEIITGEPPVAAINVPTAGGANGPPVYFDGSPSSDDFGIVEYRWDFDADVDRDGDGDATNDMDAVGPRPFHTYGQATNAPGVLFEDHFDGTALDDGKWEVANAGQAGGALVMDSPNNGWGRNWALGRTTFERERISVRAVVTQPASITSHTMVGVKNTSSTNEYRQMPHAIYFDNGTLRIYENGSNRGAVGSYNRGTSYEVRIDLKPGGADYFIREEGTDSWRALTGFSATIRTETPLKVFVDHWGSDEATVDGVIVEALGGYQVTLTVEDGAGQTATATATVQVDPNLPPDVITVPWVAADPIAPHETYNGKRIHLKGMVRDADAEEYQWDFGDGTQSARLAVTNPFDLGTAHTYPDAPAGTPFVATLKVWDGAGQMAEATYNVVVKPENLTTEINVAIDEGLWRLHKIMDRTSTAGYRSGFWDDNGHSTSYWASTTGSALQAFQINGHFETGDHRTNPYAETVDRGLKRLFTGLRRYGSDLTTQGAGEPDTNGNDMGIEVASGRPIYEGGMVMDGIATTRSPLARAVTGDGNINRRRYFDILTDMVDQFAWGQEESGSARGGWRYSWDGGSDNSAAQWGAIGMQAAEDIFGIPIPPFVKAENREHWLWNSYREGFGYTGGGTDRESTPSGIVQLAFVDLTTDEGRWITSEGWIASDWIDWSTNPSRDYLSYYALFAFTKAMRLANPEPVTNLRATGLDWFDDPEVGVARLLIDDQQPDGRFGVENRAEWVDDDMRDAWGVVILSRSLFVQPPVADAGRDVVWAVDLPITLDGSASFHPDPFRSIVRYEWDFDGDGVFDRTTTNPTVEYTYSSADYPQVVDPDNPTPVVIDVRLRVRDNNVPPLTDTDTVEVTIAEPPHPPIADAGGPYICTQGLPCALDGTGSFDIDPTDFITLYEWDLNGFPLDYDGATGPTPAPVFDTVGVFRSRIALRVWDNAVLNDVNGNGQQDEDERLPSEPDFADLTVVPNEAPEALVGGPYEVPEGSTVTVSDAGSGDPNGDPITYAWDLDGDGAFDDADGPTASFAGVDDGVNDIALEISDSLLTDVAATTVEVVNVPPAVDAGGDRNVVESSSLTFGGSFTDPGAEDTHTVVWDFGDGGGATGSVSPSHTYADDGTYTVTLTVTDDDGGIGSDTLTVTVENAGPVVSPPDDQAILEGQSVTVNGVAFSDAGLADTHSATIGWGDGDTGGGTVNQAAGGGTADFGSHTYAEDGIYTVTVTVTDDDGGRGTATATITVDNAAPVVDAGADQAVAGGTPAALNPATYTDAGILDTHTAMADWGDGSTGPATVTPTGPGAGQVTAAHTYASDGSYTVTITVTDDDGDAGSDTFQVVVSTDNLPPIADAGGPYDVDEGSTVTLDAGASRDQDDKPGSGLSFAWDLDGDNTFDDGSGPTVVFAGVDDGDYGVRVRVSDGELAVVAGTEVRVHNVPPTVAAGADVGATVGATVSFAGTFTDPGIQDTHTIEWDFGDGNGATGGLEPGHAYGAPGTYTVVLAVTDDDGGVGTDDLTVTVTDTTAEPQQTIFDLLARAKYERTTGGKIGLRWSPVAAAEGYNIYRTDEAGGAYTLLSSTGPCPYTYCSYTDFGLLRGVTYYYVVTSIEAGVESLNSNEASATPQERRRRTIRRR